MHYCWVFQKADEAMTVSIQITSKQFVNSSLSLISSETWFLPITVVSKHLNSAADKVYPAAILKDKTILEPHDFLDG